MKCPLPLLLSQMLAGTAWLAVPIAFVLSDAFFPGVGVTGADVRIRVRKGDAVVRFLRVVKLSPPQDGLPE